MLNGLKVAPKVTIQPLITVKNFFSIAQAGVASELPSRSDSGTRNRPPNISLNSRSRAITIRLRINKRLGDASDDCFDQGSDGGQVKLPDSLDP